jgi:hypothetical protein
MGLKYKNGKLTLKTKAGLIKGYLPEPNQYSKEKCNKFVNKIKK